MLQFEPIQNAPGVVWKKAPSEGFTHLTSMRDELTAVGNSRSSSTGHQIVLARSGRWCAHPLMLGDSHRSFAFAESVMARIAAASFGNSPSRVPSAANATGPPSIEISTRPISRSPPQTAIERGLIRDR
jgi:hypothetical protein